MSGRPRSRGRAIGEAVSSFLEKSGLADRVQQAGIIPEWPGLVGPQIASVTEPVAISRDGTLFVNVKTNAWMTELSLLEPQLLRSLNNSGDGRGRVARIHWRLMR